MAATPASTMKTTTATSSSTKSRTILRSLTSGTKRRRAETAWRATTTSSFLTNGRRRLPTTWRTTPATSPRSPTQEKPSSMTRIPTNTINGSRLPEESCKSPKRRVSFVHLSIQHGAVAQDVGFVLNIL